MNKITHLTNIFKYITTEAKRLNTSWDLMDMFAALRDGDTRLTWENETNRYQVELRMLYAEWIDDLTIDLAEYDYVAPEIIAASLLRLQDRMILLSRQRIFEGYDLGYGAGDIDYTSEVVTDLASVMASNEDYIEHSFISDLRRRITEVMQDEKFRLLGLAFLVQRLAAMGARVEMYAGAEWKAINKGVGAYARSKNLPVYWMRDGQAEHCESCLEFGDREYRSYDALLAETGGVLPADGTICRGNCRCSLLVKDGKEWVRP
jgi:hypothetical protein